jgi:hypothetical protein
MLEEVLGRLVKLSDVKRSHSFYRCVLFSAYKAPDLHLILHGTTAFEMGAPYISFRQYFFS